MCDRKLIGIRRVSTAHYYEEIHRKASRHLCEEYVFNHIQGVPF